MLKDNSKNVQKGDTFIALKGINHDGHDYIKEAINNGAIRIIAEHGKYDVDTVLVKDTKDYLNEYLKLNLGDIKLIGITGTNGKTTTAYLIYQALNMLDIKCAYIGTIGFYLDDLVKELDNTTPGSLDLFNMIMKAYNKGFKYIVMEVSSHALMQGRVDFLKFDYTIFTNLTQDHLDYHETMENYALAKQKLFKDLTKGVSIINIDSPYQDYFKFNKYITYGFNESDYEISFDNEFKVNDKTYKMNLYGKHNVYNMSCVIILLDMLKIDYKEIYNVVEKLKAPAGRMQVVNYQNNKIIIDFAHTPDAISNIISSLFSYDHLYIIFGCGGNRDKGKRSIMGNITSSLADYVIITNDNPRNEDEILIVKDILKGFVNNNYEIELNRKKAVEKGIQLLKNNDILLLLGKGPEKYQILGDKKVYYNDLEEVLRCIRR